MKQSFGEKLRLYRIDKDISQKEMASLIPMNQSNYSKIERDVQEPSLFQLKRIAEILDISVDALLGISRPTIKKDDIKQLQKDLDKILKKLFP